MKSAIAVFLSFAILFCIAVQDIPTAFAEEKEGTTTISDGVTLTVNPDGSKTITMSLSDSDVAKMQRKNRQERIVEAGEGLESTSDEIDAVISDNFDEGETLVEISDGKTSIEIAPVVCGEPAPSEEAAPSGNPAPSEEPAPSEDAAPSEKPAQSETELSGKLEPNDETVLNEGSAPRGETALSEGPAPGEGPGPEESAINNPPGPPDSTLQKNGFSSGSYESIEYNDIFDQNIDIRLEARTFGIKEDIIINEYTGIDTFEYIIKFNGLVPKKIGKEIYLYNEDKYRAKIEAPFMYDSNGKYSEDISVSITRIKGGSYRITYIADKDFLNSAGYPVVIDPSVTYTSDSTEDIKDNHVNIDNPDTNYQYNATRMTLGTKSGDRYIALIQPVFIDAAVNSILGDVIVKDAKINVYQNQSGGNVTFDVCKITGEWDTRTVTYNSIGGSIGSSYGRKTISGTGWKEIDLTQEFSEWFNALDQKANYGVALVPVSGNYLEFTSADTPSYRMTFTFTFWDDVSVPNVTLTRNGNGLNSGTGYADLSWTSVEGADTYYVGIHNGDRYNYFFTGSATGFTTKGKGIWPTQSEISSGGYALHFDGSGAELPMIPAFTYNNVPGGSYHNNLNYMFKVVPANMYGQAVNPSHGATLSTRLPDTLPPNAPTGVAVNPAGYTNANIITVSWNGITDFNDTSSVVSSSLGTGRVQYAVDSPSGWADTDSSSASGSYPFSTSGLVDGTHIVYVRGRDSAGNTGAHAYQSFYVDKTGPTAPTLGVAPGTYTNEDSISLSWSGISDLLSLGRVEYSINGSAYIDTGITQKNYSGYGIALSRFVEGSNTLSVRGVDIPGNIGAAAAVNVYKDTTGPGLDSVVITPAGWTNEDSVVLGWTGVADNYTGVQSIEYAIDGGEFADTGKTGSDDSIAINTAGIGDGEHTVDLMARDGLGNQTVVSAKMYIDKTAPVIGILSPGTNETVSGGLEIWGSIEDISLTGWVLKATGESGKTILIASGTGHKKAALLGILNTNQFMQGEKLSVTLSAEDAASNINEATVSGVTVDNSVKPIINTVNITSPHNGEIISQPSVEVVYQKEYESDEVNAYYFVDGAFSASGSRFLFNAITFAEGSAHSIAIVSEDEDGVLHYSQGFGKDNALSENFSDEEKTQTKENVAYSELGARLDGASGGEIVFKEITSDRSINLLSLQTTQNEPAGTNIEYLYSVDGGLNFSPIVSGLDEVIKQAANKVVLKAVMTGDGISSPTIYGINLSFVYVNSAPKVFSVLGKDIEGFNITQDRKITNAIIDIENNLPDSDGMTYAMYQDGKYYSNSCTYNAYMEDENSTHRLTQFALAASGDIYASGGKSAILLRENVNANSKESKLTSEDDIYAVRILALQSDGKTDGSYFYSLNGEDWEPAATGGYIPLGRASKEIYIRAEMKSGVDLTAWHIEGVSAAGKQVLVDLVSEVSGVVAADYSQYYEDEALYKTELSWNYSQAKDSTQSYTEHFDIYKDGQKVDTAADKRWTDEDYTAGAEYSVCAVRVYAGGHVHAGGRRYASVVYVSPETKIDGVTVDPEEIDQSEYLDDLYGGDYTFTDEVNPPSGEVVLDSDLLGTTEDCVYGADPVNMSTGNYTLVSDDFEGADIESFFMPVSRTYNSMAPNTNGPLGAKWAWSYGQHLKFYKNGTIAFINEQGRILYFVPDGEGKYTCGLDNEYTLSIEDGCLTVLGADGVRRWFTCGGILKKLVNIDRKTTSLKYSEKGLLEEIVTNTGSVIKVKMDALGHVVKITLPGGQETEYGYKGNNLVKFTNIYGRQERYEYDDGAYLTEIIDSSETVYLKNIYDGRGRVMKQEMYDGKTATFEYLDGRTKAVLFSGEVMEVSYNNEKRALKHTRDGAVKDSREYDKDGNLAAIFQDGRQWHYDGNRNMVKYVDEYGSEDIYKYNEEHQVTYCGDEKGMIIENEYNGEGQLVKVTYADKTTYSYEYNGLGQVVKETDRKGRTTCWEYNGNRIKKCTDCNGNVFLYEYDELSCVYTIRRQ